MLWGFYRFKKVTADGLVTFLLLAGLPSTAVAAENCAGWNTSEFFESATVALVTACVSAGADVNEQNQYGLTPLQHAAGLDDPAVAEVLLAAGADVHARNVGGNPPLHVAALNYNRSVIELLLASGADVGQRTRSGKTPLQFAARSADNPAAVEILLEAGADVHARDSNGFTPLHEAARHGNPKVIEILLAAGANIDVRSDSGTTPLYWAAWGNENSAVIDTLVRAGADPMAREKDAETVLHAAAESNANPAVINALLAVGADVNARDREGVTPLRKALLADAPQAVVDALLAAGPDLIGDRMVLHAAVARDNPELARALIEAGASVAEWSEAAGLPVHSAWLPMTPLHEAAREGAVAVLEVLLEAGADVHASDGVGTALHFARTAEVAEILLAAGADVNARQADGETPLHTTGRWNLGVLEVLLAAGADVDPRDSDGRTPLMRAALVSKIAVIEALLAAGADANSTDEEGWTLLHSAVRGRKNVTVIKSLLAAGADLHARNADGQTPLWVAAKYNENPAVFEVLLAAGADMHVVDNHGWTLLHAAAANEHPTIVHQLLTAGADTNARDQHGETPLHQAASYSGWVEYDSDPTMTKPAWPSHSSPAVIEVLLAAGANVHARDNFGRTPLHGAARLNRNAAVVETLLAAGADVAARNKAGVTPPELTARYTFYREVHEMLQPTPGPAAPRVVEGDGAGVEAVRDCPICPELVVVPGAAFWMGMPDRPGPRGIITIQGIDAERHIVAVASFALSRYEVTRGQFTAFVAATGHDVEGGCVGTSMGTWLDKSWQSNDHPVVCVSWDDAQAYVRWLSEETGRVYRLPTEAEWEYAARAGTGTQWFWGDQEADRCGFANGGGDLDCNDGTTETAPVGSFGANAFGLHDMAGNVWEWVEDCWHGSYEGAPRDGAAWVRGGDCGRRVVRGGSWLSVPGLLASGHRQGSDASYRSVNRGFRVARSLVVP